MAVKMSGGLGRIVCALPALTEAKQLVITDGWNELYTMTNLTRIEHSSAFIEQALDDDDVIAPEPYFSADYRSGKTSMVEEFHKALGTVQDENKQYLYPNVASVEHWIKHFKAITDLPLAMIQVEASSAIRDISQQNLDNTIKALKDKGFFPVVIGELQRKKHSEYSVIKTSITDLVSLIAVSNLVICPDSSCLHIATALNKKYIAFLTSTAGVKYHKANNFYHFVNNNYPNTFEHPRLFAGEITRRTHNESLSLDYVVSIEEIKEQIDLL